MYILKKFVKSLMSIISSPAPISYEIALKKQIINIEPPITRMEITSSKNNYKK